MTRRESDPCGAHCFRVFCDALPDLGFTEVRGLSVAVGNPDDEAATRRRGSPPGRGRGVPTSDRVSPAEREAHSPPLELRRGVTDDRALWAWLQDWLAGDVEPQDVRICLLDARERPVRGWLCRAARPVRWTGPDLVADRPAVATESLELAHAGIDSVGDLDECAGPTEPSTGTGRST
ncbi:MULTISPECIES: phage tail protein [Salinibaculum]|uniref:phage tail protein n=1 Tax=Salinibaculum TaxID=2732368 RepID=UPI0030CCB637